MEDSDRVVLSVPCRGEFARTVRLAGAELAARSGMCIDDIDDIRLAVEEAFVFACESSGGGQMTFSFQLAPGSLELQVGPLHTESEDSNDAETAARYSKFILESVCDEYERLERADGYYLRLVKRTA